MINLLSPARLGAIVAVAALALDQATKFAALAWMRIGQPIPAAPILDLRLGFNEGVSFGMLAGLFAGRPWAPIGLAVCIVVALAVWLSRVDNAQEAVGLGAVIGGALGNVADRTRLGAVVDFLDFHVAGYHWPAFNLGDAAIVVGVTLLLTTGLRRGARTNERDRAAAQCTRGGVP